MNEQTAVRTVIDLLCKAEKQTAIKSLISDLMPSIPRNAEGFDLICYAYYKAKDLPMAVKYGELALGGASAEEALAIRYNLGKCYLNANEPIKARNCFSIVAGLQPEVVDIKLDLAAALYACNQKEEAHKLLLELDEIGWQFDTRNELAIKFNLGAHAIRTGDFKAGIEYLSIGRKLRIWGSYTHQFPIPEWDGKTVEGRHILIIGEGGIGDEIINARFVHHINARGMKASFASCQGLASVFARMPFEKTQNYQKFTTDIGDIQDYDCWTPAMNLPKVLGVEQSELWSGPYLTPDPELDKKWHESMFGFRIGIRWSGNPLYEQDLHRSISLEKVVECLPPGCHAYSIQKENTEGLVNFPHVINLEESLTTFEEAIACINNLNVVVTSCTSVAHAAAALGKRVFIMVPIMDYYVWAEGLSKSSWYGDNVTLIRQSKPKSWDSAYAELKAHLEAL